MSIERDYDLDDIPDCPPGVSAVQYGEQKDDLRTWAATLNGMAAVTDFRLRLTETGRPRGSATLVGEELFADFNDFLVDERLVLTSLNSAVIRTDPTIEAGEDGPTERAEREHRVVVAFARSGDVPTGDRPVVGDDGA